MIATALTYVKISKTVVSTETSPAGVAKNGYTSMPCFNATQCKLDPMYNGSLTKIYNAQYC